jgi:hypothetical protein
MVGYSAKTLALGIGTALAGVLFMSGCARDQASPSPGPQDTTRAADPQPKGPHPTAPYENHGACPFECCTYREWIVEKDADVFDDFRKTGLVKFRLKHGEKVTAITGVVVTTQLGVAVVTDAISPNKGLKPGDRIDVLHHVGEGHWKYWFNGHSGEDQIDTREVCQQRRPPAPPCEFELVTPPQTEWWAHIRTTDGRDGWTKPAGYFGNMDACG